MPNSKPDSEEQTVRVPIKTWAGMHIPEGFYTVEELRERAEWLEKQTK